MADEAENTLLCVSAYKTIMVELINLFRRCSGLQLQLLQFQLHLTSAIQDNFFQSHEFFVIISRAFGWDFNVFSYIDVNHWSACFLCRFIARNEPHTFQQTKMNNIRKIDVNIVPNFRNIFVIDSCQSQAEQLVPCVFMFLDCRWFFVK